MGNFKNYYLDYLISFSLFSLDFLLFDLDFSVLFLFFFYFYVPSFVFLFYFFLLPSFSFPLSEVWFLRAPFCSLNIFYNVLFLLYRCNMFFCIFEDINDIFWRFLCLPVLYLSPISYFLLVFCSSLCLSYEILFLKCLLIFVCLFIFKWDFKTLAQSSVPITRADCHGLSCKAIWSCQYF